MTLPTVSVVVPAYNEAERIDACLASIVANDYPADRLEILVVDGGSTDGTRDVVARWAAKDPRIRLVENPARHIPAAMNAGIRAACHEIVVKMDAHSEFPHDYLRRTVAALVETGAMNAGGVVIATARDGSPSARAIAIALNSPLASLGSSFRTAGSGGRREADAVAFGCWPRSLFDEVGLFHEKLKRSSDIELNKRIVAKGGRIVLDPSIRLRYFPEATLRRFWRKNVIDGYWATYPYRFAREVVSLRHAAPLIALLALAALALGGALWWPLWAIVASGLAIYVAALGIGSAVESSKVGAPGLAVRVAAAAAARHWAYGAGSLAGAAHAFAGRLVDLATRRS